LLGAVDVAPAVVRRVEAARVRCSADAVRIREGRPMRALIFVAAVLALAESARAADTKQRLVGSWRLVSYEDRPAKGAPAFPNGMKPRGFLTYDATGQMAIES
jgi:hypothetical protein